MNTDSSLFQRIGYASHGATEGAGAGCGDPICSQCVELPSNGAIVTGRREGSREAVPPLWIRWMAVQCASLRVCSGYSVGSFCLYWLLPEICRLCMRTFVSHLPGFFEKSKRRGNSEKVGCRGQAIQYNWAST